MRSILRPAAPRSGALGAAALWGLVLALPGGARGADPTPFQLVGPIEKFTLNAVGDPACAPATPAPALRSARMTVHGIVVLLPCNLIIQFPATFLTAADVFRLNPTGASESGLALADTAKPLAAFEGDVAGNIVDVAGTPTHVAGLVKISQHGLAAGAGFITAIDLAAREMRIGPNPAGTVGTADARVRINDSNGRYDHHATVPAGIDTRFTVDTENPTIHALTGYPMCLPMDGVADDPECPKANRPVAGGKPLINFVMGPADLPAAPPGALPIPHCGTAAPTPTAERCLPAKQAPFTVGDYVTYSGTLAQDPSGSLFISAHTIGANVGIFTAPGSNPAYVSLDVSLVGTMGPAVARNPPDARSPTIPQESKDRLRIEGFTTDPSRNVEIYAIDANAVTGARTLRLVNVIQPRGGAVPFGRFRLTIGNRAGVLRNADGDTLGATRELMLRIANGPNLDGQPVPTGPTAANGLVAGQYVGPVGEYFFPEATVLGDPQIPLNFECLAFLQAGSGPLSTAGNSGPVVGRLAPWPGPVPAAGPVACGP